MDILKTAIRRHIDDERLSLGIVRAKGVTVAESTPSFRTRVDELVNSVLTQEKILPDEVRSKVRHMMKLGGFSPSGRNRPASEFILREIAKNRSFKYINNVVDINNYMSAKVRLPMSIFDAGRINGALVIRIGNPGEGYVFNNEGHVIDVKKLIVCCEEQHDYTSIPFGSPVKDSMHTKVFPGCTDVLAVIYSASALYSRTELEAICEEMCGLLAEYADSAETVFEIR
ncbi:hypothetical protein J7K50_01465 [bacterium]|nr:hypothetical protein [bacterium]